MWFIWIMWVIVALAIIATIILLTGKGSMLVSGFNTKSPGFIFMFFYFRQ